MGKNIGKILSLWSAVQNSVQRSRSEPQSGVIPPKPLTRKVTDMDTGVVFDAKAANSHSSHR